MALRPYPASRPYLINAEAPRPRIEAIRILDMNASNSWAEFAALFRNTREAFLDHERAKSELKALIPEDAKEAIGHGVRAKRSKSGAGELRRPGRRRRPMPRASESVAALASALAKAQAEAVNPEKSLTALIRTGRPGEGERSFRYEPGPSPVASTSCARRSGSMRLRPCRPPPSTILPAWSVPRPPRLRTPPANGSPPTGQFVPLPKLPIPSAWAPR